jgi:hypothetical protein
MTECNPPVASNAPTIAALSQKINTLVSLLPIEFATIRKTTNEPHPESDFPTIAQRLPLISLAPKVAGALRSTGPTMATDSLSQYTENNGRNHSNQDDN